MKITITPETEEEKKKLEMIGWENVDQYSICGRFIREGFTPGQFRFSVIVNANELIGQLESNQEDIKDEKCRSQKQLPVPA